jgi:hypothetical protein
MSHLDEGTLHALLDGELDLAEVNEIQGHLGSCVACGARLQEVKQFMAEADRLVGALNVPAAERVKPAPPQSRTPRKSPPFSSPFHEPDPWEPPVILLPEATDSPGRRKWFRAFRWAAMIAVVIGGGRWLLNNTRSSISLPADRDITMAAPAAAPPAVASRQEIARPDSTVAVAKSRTPRPAAPARPPASKAAAESKIAAKEPTVDSAVDTSQALVDSLASSNTDSAPAEDETVVAAGAAESVSADSSTDSVASEKDEAVNRRAAAEALAQLDLQRRRERAAAATAALPPARAEVQPAAPAPAPRTPEQRAQIYLRIGLDEAVKQLGGPLHVIEGMTPQLIGLVQGRLVAGADPNRPVVRVVYLDTRGRMILLDQQRLRAGQSAGAVQGNLRWAVGDVMLYLRGEPSADVLQTLQRRVR